MDKTVLYQNKKIFYRDIGTGDPVMLVHGFGEDGNVWDKQVEYLKDKYHLLVPDLPGSGQSELINDMSMKGWPKCCIQLFMKKILTGVQ